MTTAAIVTRGWGSFGSVAEIVTAGFLSGAEEESSGPPIVERIAEVIVARLASVPNITGVLRARSGSGIIPGHMKVIVVQRAAQNSPDHGSPGSPQSQGWRQDFELHCCIRPDKAETDDDDLTLNIFVADCVRAIAAPQATWHTFGNLAINARFEDSQGIVTSQAGHIIRQTTLAVTYRTEENDPHTET